MKFIKDHFDTYEADKFSNAWMLVNDPLMIICQICFWVYSYFFSATEKETSLLWAIFKALYYAFGGVMVYALLSLIVFCVAFAINKRKPGFIMLVIGIIGAILAFKRLY